MSATEWPVHIYSAGSHLDMVSYHLQDVCHVLQKHIRPATHLVGLGLQLLLSHAVGPEVPEDAANRVGQHDLDLGVHVLQEAASATDGTTSAATSNKVGHP